MEKDDNHEVITPQGERAGNNLVELISRAEIDQQITTAKQYPRSIKAFMDDARAMVTLNEAVAESCNYGLPRGGKIITGPSVRFAEIIYSAWGNCRAGTRIIHEDSRFVTAQGVCHDLQRNTMITKDVKRRITSKEGKTFNDDMVGVTGNAASSIALRNAILAVIPKAFWEPLYDESRKVAMGDSKTLATRRADALAVMQKFGVSLDMILAKFEIKGEEDISLEILQTLNGCRNSLKNGETTVEALFPTEKPATEAKGNEAVKNKLAEKSGGRKKPSKEEAAVAAGADPKTGELPTGGKGIGGGGASHNDGKSGAAVEGGTLKISDMPASGFDTSQIGVKGDAQDNTRPDYEAWKTEFYTRCNKAPSLEEIGALYAHNAGILNQWKTRNPAVFEECDQVYTNNVNRLKSASR